METSSRRARARLVFKAIEVRLRFVAVLAVIGFTIVSWDSIENHVHKWLRRAPPVSVAAAAGSELFCPMHPSVVRPLDAEGESAKCPICGMPLAVRKKVAGSMLSTPGRVQLSPERIAAAGVKTVAVSFRPLDQVIEASGSVQYDEGRLSKIVARVSGYLEKLYLDESFVPVSEGAPLAEIYSPELYTAVRELLLTRGDQSSPIAAASRERLRLLGVDDKEIARILEKGESDYRVVIRSPQSGHVIERDVVRGSYVTVGQTLFEVADLSSVWIEADVYEKDIPFLHEGETVDAWVDAVPNQVFEARIALIHPHVMASTRTITLRFAVANPNHLLRPGMFATVRVKTSLAKLAPWRTAGADSAIVSSGSVLAVPERAVIDTGTRQLVYVEREPGVFYATSVEVGPRVESYYPVLAGVHAGERVASAGAFLVDAETRLDPAAGATYTGAQGSPRAEASAEPSAELWKELSPEDRRAALAQRVCPVSGDVLGAMGTPFKTIVNGRTYFLCCASCKPKLEERQGDRREHRGDR